MKKIMLIGILLLAPSLLSNPSKERTRFFTSRHAPNYMPPGPVFIAYIKQVKQEKTEQLKRLWQKIKAKQ